MALTAVIAVLACPIITPAYDAFPGTTVNESIRIGTHVSADTLIADAKGRIKIRFQVSGKDRDATVLRQCVAADDDFQKMTKWSGTAKFVAEMGDYEGRYEIHPNGTATRKVELCADGNCEGQRYTVAKDCPGGKLSGNTCERTFEIVRAHDLYAFRAKGEKSYEDPFMLDYEGKPISFDPSP